MKKIKDWVIGKRADNRVFDGLAWGTLDDLARLDNAEITQLPPLADGTQITRIDYPDGSDILRVEQHIDINGRNTSSGYNEMLAILEHALGRASSLTMAAVRRSRDSPLGGSVAE